MYFGRKSYFLTVAETKNITRAAQLLHVSQPSLTQYLNRLEQDLGVKLLNRNVTPIQLTEAGQIYLDYVRESAEVEKRLETRLEQYKQRKNQTFSVGIPSQLIPTIFDRLVRPYALKNPNVELTVKEGTSLTITEHLIRGEADIAFFHTRERSDTRFVRHLLKREELLLACGRDSLLAGGRASTRDNPIVMTEKDLRNLAEMRFLTPPRDYYLHRVIMELIQETGISPKKIMELPQAQSIAGYITESGSDGVSVLADFALRPADESRMTFFRMEGRQLIWYLTMNRLADTELPTAAQAFWNDVASQTPRTSLPE